MANLTLALVTALLVTLARTIEVTSSSSCLSTCGGGLTFGTDLTCSDRGYNNTDIGRRMQACLECESTSTASQPSEGNDTAKNDLYWLLFNMKYTLQTCLFANTTNTSGMPACSTSCDSLKANLETSWFQTPMLTQYKYCELDGGSFPANADGCATCLKGKPGSIVLGNFLKAMNSACSSKPNATLGQTLTLPQPLFQVVESISNPTSSSAPSPTATTSSSSAPTPSTSISPAVSSGLSTGASVGIGVGVGVAALAALATITAWLCLRRKKRQTYGDDKTDAPLPNYSQAPRPLELHTEHSRYPEEMDGASSPGLSTKVDIARTGSNMAPAELGP